jgi:hypothetical protein
MQDATVAALGPIGGWKVGAKSPEAEPVCAPLPASGMLASGARSVDRSGACAASRRRWRCAWPATWTVARCRRLPSTPCSRPSRWWKPGWPTSPGATRWPSWPTCKATARWCWARPPPLRPGEVDLREVEAEQRFDGRVVAADTRRQHRPPTCGGCWTGWPRTARPAACRCAPGRWSPPARSPACSSPRKARRWRRRSAGIGTVRLRF